MPFYKKLRYLLISSLLILITFIIYSCKSEDNPAGPGEETGDATIQLISPAKSDTITALSSYEIKWQSNSTTAVMIAYSSDNGETWEEIVSSTPNDGSYLWDPVPNVNSQLCRIMIATIDETAYSTNDGTFKILKSKEEILNLGKPNGGELLFAGDSYTISWVSNDVSQIKLEFSSDNGGSWNVIAPNFPADSGNYNWPVPDVTSNNCLVRISDVSGTLKDTSNSVFSIGQPQDIRVTAPNGGEEWPAKSSKVITWYSSQVSKVKIEFSSDNGVNWTSIADSTESDGYFIWERLPDIPTTNAKIRISDAKDNYPSDVSNDVFTVAPEEALSLVEPNGGEQWISGSSQYIKWNSNKTAKAIHGGRPVLQLTKNSPAIPQQVSSVKLEYTTNAGASWSIIAENVDNSGSYQWNTIPSINSSLCKVRISDMQDGVPYDLSDSTFTIYNSVQQEVLVTSPNGGEIWQAGTSQAITWTAVGISSVKIEYTLNNGLSWFTVVNSTASDGYFNWTQIPNSSSTNCRVRITDADDGFPSDFSNAVFTIAPEPEITVISPNGNESLQAGTSTNIRWTSTNISDVKIEYTTNNGANWTLVDPASPTTPSDGLFEWKNLPDISSSLCRVRISDADDGQPYDISDNNFSITNQVVQTIQLVTPNGTEEWEAGTSHDIVWTASAINAVKVEYTTNNGGIWNTIADSVPSSGSVEWNLPSDINSTQCKIRVKDMIDGSPVDESDMPFTIKKVQSIKVVYPNGGESLIAGDTVHIKWEAKGIEKVKIEFTVTNSLINQNWYTLVDDIPSMGTNGEYIASFTVPSNECRIRISDASDGNPIDGSDGVFMVAPQQLKTITVTSPNGGENWILSNSFNSYSYEVRWRSTNVERVNIDYTIDGGAHWNSMVSNIPSNGLYNWTTPQSISFRSDLCRVKITSTVDSSLYDLSDENFAIHPQAKMIRMVFPNGYEKLNPSSRPDTVIQWVSFGIDRVNLELSLDNGVTWAPLDWSSTDIQSTGAYRWTLPDINITSSNARIRVTDAQDAGYSDMSDSYFYLNLYEPVFQILPPIKQGGEYNIGWKAASPVKDVKIEYSVNNGKTWKTISQHINSVKGNNNYKWKPDTAANEVLLRISDSSGRHKAATKKFRIE